MMAKEGNTELLSWVSPSVKIFLFIFFSSTRNGSYFVIHLLGLIILPPQELSTSYPCENKTLENFLLWELLLCEVSNLSIRILLCFAAAEAECMVKADSFNVAVLYYNKGLTCNGSVYLSIHEGLFQIVHLFQKRKRSSINVFLNVSFDDIVQGKKLCKRQRTK